MFLTNSTNQSFTDIDFNQYIDIRYYTDKEFRLPKLPKPTGIYMKPINVTKPGIIKQLKNINPSKQQSIERSCRLHYTIFRNIVQQIHQNRKGTSGLVYRKRYSHIQKGG